MKKVGSVKQVPVMKLRDWLNDVVHDCDWLSDICVQGSVLLQVVSL